MKRLFDWIAANAEGWALVWIYALMEDIDPREARELHRRYVAWRKGPRVSTTESNAARGR